MITQMTWLSPVSTSSITMSFERVIYCTVRGMQYVVLCTSVRLTFFMWCMTELKSLVQPFKHYLVSPYSVYRLTKVSSTSPVYSFYFFILCYVWYSLSWSEIAETSQKLALACEYLKRNATQRYNYLSREIPTVFSLEVERVGLGSTDGGTQKLVTNER